VSHHVYRHYNSCGELLYVGISLCAIARLKQHSKSKWFDEITKVEIEYCCSREYAQFVESMAIQLESPRHNKVHPSYDTQSASLVKEVVRQARAEIWVKSWDPAEDCSSHEESLAYCFEEENEMVDPWYRRQKEAKK
jgi:hypothetical protein